MTEPAEILREYLDAARSTMLWKLEGLSEYDVRRPLTPTGTNLLGLVKHLSMVEAGYLGLVFDRPFPEPMPWAGPDAEPNADMWATAAESRDDVVDRYRRVHAHGDATIEELGLDGTGTVPWWPAERNPVTVHRILVHLIAETNRHLGHADIVREAVDGGVGYREGVGNLPPLGDDGWEEYRGRVEAAARAAGDLDG